MTKYEQFQEWLNQCPVKVIDYQDFSDQFQITFDVPLEDDANDVAQCIVDTNGAYAECVDRMVDTMKSPVELENVTDAWYDKEGNLIP